MVNESGEAGWHCGECKWGGRVTGGQANMYYFWRGFSGVVGLPLRVVWLGGLLCDFLLHSLPVGWRGCECK